MTESSTYELSPQEVTSWLLANGWQRLSSGDRPAVLWARGSHELVQPLRPEATDYELRLHDMLRVLTRSEERDAGLLSQEIKAEGADVCEWRARLESESDYTIALEDGERLIRGVRNAVIAAANASIRLRGYFGHSTKKAAREHARMVRMGQTRHGSYVVPIISRIPGVMLVADEDDTLDIEVSVQPFERRVMEQLAEALSTINTISIENPEQPDARVVNESVASGVSYELCAAVANVLTADSILGLDVSFGWARRLPRSHDISTVEFSRESGPAVSHMANLLRGSEVVAEQVVYGYVRGHKHEHGDSLGEVTVRTGKSDRLVRIPLDEQRLGQALQAASEGRPVVATGSLVREPGRIWHFDSVSQFGFAEFIPE